MRVAGLVVCVSGVLLALGPLNHHHRAFCEEEDNMDHHKTSSPSSTAAASSSSTSSASSQQISSSSSSSSSSATNTQSQQAEDGGDPPQCSMCASVRQHIKTMRLNAIKSQILSKLRLRAAPNISRDVVQQLLPRAPPLQRLLDQYDALGDMQYRRAPPGAAAAGGGERMQGAAAAATDEEDEEHAFAETIKMMATQRERTGEQQHRHDGERMQDAAATDEEDEEHAFAETIMMMATQPDPRVQVNQVPKCCLFSFRQKLQVSRVVRAQLWVHLRAPEQDTNVSLQISRLMPVTADGRRRVRIRFLEMEVAAGVGSWQSIDVKQLLSGWLRKPDTNFGIEINAFDARGTDLAVSSTLPGEEGLQPFLEVKISDVPRRSRRDSGLDCDENSPESRCCRYPLMVDFEDFGWDWIIAPKRYKANYCIGECEYLHLEKYPHTHLVNKATPRGTAGPCCTPKKVSPINMLYFNDKEEIVYGKIPSMVVDRCGCS